MTTTKARHATPNEVAAAAIPMAGALPIIGGWLVLPC